MQNQETNMNQILTCIIYTQNSCLFEDEPARFVTKIQGDVILLNEFDEEIVAGKVKYFFINTMAVDCGPDYLLDLVSNTEPFIGEIYRPNSFEFKKKIENLSEFGIYNTNLLILDRLEILPEFRGNDYSRRIIDDGIKNFGSNAGLMALKAFPLQLEYHDENKLQDDWNKRMNIDRTDKDEKKAFTKLISYYRKLGFKKINKNNIMVKPIE